MRMMRRALITVIGVCIATHAAAQTVEQFYKGPTVSLIVGFNPGGAYDPYARTVARHLPNHLPGAPNIVVKNMQGAGSVLAANHLYNVSPKDGSELGLIAGSAALESVFAVRPSQYDGRKFTWIGSANDEPGVCFAWRDSDFTTAKDLFDKQLLIGASGTSNLDFPLALNAVAGTKM
jgi:tripartite-type tricarboxylate transporter receptor subunit TctC